MVGMNQKEKWLTLEGWAEETAIPIDVIKQRLKGVPSVIGKHDKRLADFYSERDIRRQCADLLKARGPM
jgi:hypothetical protein